MTFKIKLSKLLSHMNVGIVNKSIKIKHVYCKNLVPILKLLVSEGFLFGFKLTSCKKYFIIYLKFNKGYSSTNFFLLKSKVSSSKFISSYKLNSLNYKNPTFFAVTSSNKGLSSKSTSGVGGEYLFEIK